MKQVVEGFAINEHLGDHESGPGEHGPRHALDEKAGAEMERCKWHLRLTANNTMAFPDQQRPFLCERNNFLGEKTSSARGSLAASIIEQFGDRKHPDLVSFAGSDEDFLMRRIQTIPSWRARGPNGAGMRQRGRAFSAVSRR